MDKGIKHNLKAIAIFLAAMCLIAYLIVAIANRDNPTISYPLADYPLQSEAWYKEGGREEFNCFQKLAAIYIKEFEVRRFYTTNISLGPSNNWNRRTLRAEYGRKENFFIVQDSYLKNVELPADNTTGHVMQVITRCGHTEYVVSVKVVDFNNTKSLNKFELIN